MKPKTINYIEKFYQEHDDIFRKISAYLKTLTEDRTRRINDKRSPTLAIGFNKKFLDAFLIPNIVPKVFSNFDSSPDIFLNSLDDTFFKRVILFHYAEFFSYQDSLFSEIFRILESHDSEVIIIAFNKTLSRFSNSFLSRIKLNMYDLIDSLEKNSFEIYQISGINHTMFKFLPYNFSYTFSRYTDFAINLFPIFSDIIIVQATKVSLGVNAETILNPSYDAV